MLGRVRTLSSLAHLAALQLSFLSRFSASNSNISSLQSCGECFVWGQLENQPRFPIQAPAYPSYITEVVNINPNGTTSNVITDQSASQSFDSYINALSSSIAAKMGPAAFVDIVLPDLVEPIVTWVFYLWDATYSTSASMNGTQTCARISTSFSEMHPYLTLSESIPTSILSTTLDGLLDGNPPFLPSSYFSSIGLNLPSNCSLHLNGIPVAQIPVQYLTVTSTVKNVAHTSPASTTSALPGPVLQPPGPTATAESPPPALNSGSQPSVNDYQSPSSLQETPNPQANSNPSPDVGSNPIPNGDFPIQTVVTIGGVPFSISGSSVFVSSQTILPGGSPVVDNGVSISLAPSATAVVVGPSTIQLLPSAAAGPAATPAPTFQLGSLTYTANAAGAFTIDSQTLTPGGVITISGTRISLAPSATDVVIDGSTIPLYDQSAPSTANARLEMLTLGSDVYTANSASDFVIDGQTLTPGGVITVDGTVISLAPGATEVVVGSSTEVLTEAPTTTPVGVGGVIYSAFGGESHGGSANASAIATGTAGEGFATGAGSPRVAAMEGKWMLWTVYIIVQLLWMI